MALADGGSGYTAPATIRQMRDELHWLPLWWAKDDDLVWNGEDRITLSEGDEIRPWGWSAALVHQLKQAGVDEKFLPSPDQLDSLRRLSHRQTAVEALAQCREEGLLGKRLAGGGGRRGTRAMARGIAQVTLEQQRTRTDAL